jgi:hypothetical protein
MLHLLAEMTPAQLERAAVTAEALDTCLDHCTKHLRCEVGGLKEVTALVAKLCSPSDDNDRFSTPAVFEQLRQRGGWYRLLGACAVRGVAECGTGSMADSQVVLSNLCNALTHSAVGYTPLAAAADAQRSSAREVQDTEAAARAPIAFSYEEEEGLVRNSNRLLDLVRAAAGGEIGAASTSPPLQACPPSSDPAPANLPAEVRDSPAEQQWIPPQRRAAMEAGYTLFSLEEEEGVVSNAERLAALVRSAADSTAPPNVQEATTGVDVLVNPDAPGGTFATDVQALIDTAIALAEDLQGRLALPGRVEEALAVEAQLVARGEASLSELHALIQRSTRAAVTARGFPNPHYPSADAKSAHFAFGLLEEALLIYKGRHGTAAVDTGVDQPVAPRKRRRLLTRFFHSFALS